MRPTPISQLNDSQLQRKPDTNDASLTGKETMKARPEAAKTSRNPEQPTVAG